MIASNKLYALSKNVVSPNIDAASFCFATTRLGVEPTVEILVIILYWSHLFYIGHGDYFIVIAP